MEEERSAVIKISGEEFTLVLTTRATKEIGKRYGGIENLGEKLMQSDNFELALDEISWLITLLANQSILIHNLRNKDAQRPLITEEEIELLTTPLELSEYKDAILTAMFKGMKRNVESEESKNMGAGEQPA